MMKLLALGLLAARALVARAQDITSTSDAISLIRSATREYIATDSVVAQNFGDQCIDRVGELVRHPCVVVVVHACMWHDWTVAVTSWCTIRVVLLVCMYVA